MDICEIIKKLGSDKIPELAGEIFKLSLIDSTKDDLNTFLHNYLKNDYDFSSEDVIDSLEKEDAISFNPMLQFNILQIMAIRNRCL